jgi:hypothetical protein
MAQPDRPPPIDVVPDDDVGHWVYMETPELLKMPPCRYCRNRLRIHSLAQGIYWCGDCMRPFAAVWVRPGVVPPEILLVDEA